MAEEKVLIAVKTYPAISGKYTELACTAGFRADGSWIRLYPIPFRLLDHDKRYKKYQWIEVDIARNKGDQRPESHRVLNAAAIRLLNRIGTEREWEDRRRAEQVDIAPDHRRSHRMPQQRDFIQVELG